MWFSIIGRHLVTLLGGEYIKFKKCYQLHNQMFRILTKDREKFKFLKFLDRLDRFILDSSRFNLIKIGQYEIDEKINTCES